MSKATLEALAARLSIEALHLLRGPLTASLRRYQEFGARFLAAQGRSILGDDMGLGKTVQVLAFMCHLHALGAKRFLVVAPNSLLVDGDKEFRIRTGLSKVPYGFVNMQSSQNRIALERADAINSAAEGERDMGAFFYWAPKHIRDLFKDLVKSGRKGSGDYGVIGVGAYTGQGPNRSDRNGDVHVAARASYPFQFGEQQVVELGVQGYTGEYVVTTGAIGATTPTVDAGGVDDERVAATFVVYPAPIGIEAEWNWGNSPQLSDDLSRIDAEYVQGGYVQAHYMLKTESGTWFPFTRWNFFDGARKFATNAPKDEVNELDIGVEWQATPEIEVTLQYTHTFWRTDTSDVTGTPYEQARGDDRIGFQVQVNF